MINVVNTIVDSVTNQDSEEGKDGTHPKQNETE